MVKKNSPGCGCCGCALFSDDFNRADSSTIGNGWVEAAGDFSIVSNKLSVAEVDARCNQEIVLTDPSLSISVKMSSSGDGDKLKIYTDNGSAFVQLTIGTSAKITISNTGTTICDVIAPVDTEHTVKFIHCTGARNSQPLEAGLPPIYMPGIMVLLNGVAVAWCTYDSQGGIPSPFDIGLGTGDVAAGTITFDDFVVESLEGVNEVQSISVTGSPTGGTFTLTMLEGTTVPIAYNAGAAAIKSAIETLVGAGNVIAPSGTLPVSVDVTFCGDLSRINRDQMVPDSSGLTGGTDPAAVVVTSVDGRACPFCFFCHPLLDATHGHSQVKVIIADLIDSDAPLNGTYYLDRITVACTDDPPSITNLGASPCGCYELTISGTLGGDPVDKMRAYGIGEANNGSTKYAFVELIDTGAGLVRGSGWAFDISGCVNADVTMLGLYGLAAATVTIGPP